MNSEQTSMRVLGLRTGAVALVFVLAGGCATSGSLAITNSDSAGAGAAKGAVGGAGVCLLPAYGGGVVGGPIGLMIGGAVSLACLPFGLVIGAVVGADKAGPQQQRTQEHEQALQEHGQALQPQEHGQAQQPQEYEWAQQPQEREQAQQPQEHEQAQQLLEQQQPLQELQRQATDSSNPIALQSPVQDSGQGALADRSEAAASGVPEGFPAPGTLWVYGFTDRQYSRRSTEVTVQALRIEGDTVEELVSSKMATLTAWRVVDPRESRFYEHPLGAGAALTEVAPYLLAASSGKAPVDVAAPAGYPPGGAGMPGWVTTVRHQGWEQLTVPAGTFQALRVELDGRREREVSAHGQTGRFSITAWYSPEVKRLVKLEHKTWPTSVFDRGGAQSGHDVLELLAYRPPS